MPSSCDSQITEERPQPAVPSEQSPRKDLLVILYSNEPQAVGRRYSLADGPVRIGRMDDSEIVLLEAAVSRRHTRLERLANGWMVMDAGSCNGTWVNDSELCGTQLLRSGDRITIGSTIFRYLSGYDAEAAFLEALYQLTIVDALTQIPNRFHYQQIADQEFSRSKRHKRPLSLLVIDIDLFGSVNKRYGHLAGDAVLREVAQLARRQLQREEIIARYGGEEFVILMPETTLGTARELARRVRQQTEALVVTLREVPISVTVSIGCAELVPEDQGPADLFERADSHLRAAKREGRNRVLG